MTGLRIIPLVAAAVALSVAPAGVASQRVEIRHAEPGCHWFWANGRSGKRLEVRAPVLLTNLDIRTLRVVKVSGPAGIASRLIAPGSSARIAPVKHGVYRFRIRMVDQEMMDNTLVLIVRA